MICQRCQDKQAVMQLQIQVNGALHEQHLCAACAQELGLGANMNAGMAALLSGIAGLNERARHSAACPECGMTAKQISQTGRVGCAGCYAAFSAMLRPYIKQVHGSAEHTGAIPAHAQGGVQMRREKRMLEAKLEAAVAAQEYEEAARLRDAIRELEAKQP